MLLIIFIAALLLFIAGKIIILQHDNRLGSAAEIIVNDVVEKSVIGYRCSIRGYGRRSMYLKGY